MALFLKRMLMSNLSYSELPYKLNFAITDRCNSKCKICNIWKRDVKNELTLHEIKKIFKRTDFLSWISLTGGEPFLRNDLGDIVEVISRNCKNLFVLSIPTNGLLPNIIRKKTKEFLSLEIPWYIITVSLDGPENIHNQIRGMKGGWKKAIETYKKIKTIDTEGKRLDVSFEYTISPYNIDMFEKTFNSVKKIIDNIEPKDFHITFFHCSHHYFNLNQNKKLEEFKEKLPQEIDRIYRFKNLESLNLPNVISKIYLKFGIDFAKNGYIPLKCKALFSSCFLDSTGNIYPCIIYDKKLCNLRDVNYNIRKVWKSQLANGIRKNIRNFRCPGCWLPCEANQTILGNLKPSFFKYLMGT